MAKEQSSVGTARRFTVAGSAWLEEHLARTCEQVLAEIRQLVPARKLQGLLLGGGYGRGEGGVLSTGRGDQAYNDLEFYLFLKGSAWRNQRKFGAALHCIGERVSPQAGVEVEFKILSLEKLQNSTPSMFYYDLVMGHRWLWGEESLLAGCAHHRRAELIPLSEATRLLMNRCSGLLFAEEKLQREPLSSDDIDFIFRNQAKAQLAFGDAVLTAEGQYHWSCRSRHMRLLQLKKTWPWLAAAQEYHREGVAFKLHPQRASVSRTELEARQHELKDFALQLWLWLEEQRLKQAFASARDYALSWVDKCPEAPRWRNILVNLNTFGPASLWHSRLTRYPRERVFHALALLLWESDVLNDPALLHRVQNELSTKANTFPDLVRAYRNLWQRFN